jgi:hypothetical protein
LVLEQVVVALPFLVLHGITPTLDEYASITPTIENTAIRSQQSACHNHRDGVLLMETEAVLVKMDSWFQLFHQYGKSNGGLMLLFLAWFVPLFREIRTSAMQGNLIAPTEEVLC